MKRIIYHTLAALTLVAMTSVAYAQTPNPNGVAYDLRVWNDCPASTVTTGGSYPSGIYIDDSVLPCSGFANQHLWKFSEDGGATPAEFHNNSNFSFCAELVISGNDINGGEAGISISPWWSKTDGRFQVRVHDGVVEAWGGRLPYYSFTANHGVSYVLGQTIYLGMEYISGPFGPSAGAPAQIQYTCGYGGNTYTSPWLLFDEGNVAEGLVHGNWGILDPAQAGGFFMAKMVPGDFTSNLRATWNNICYSNLQVVPTQNTSWGRVKSLYN